MRSQNTFHQQGGVQKKGGTGSRTAEADLSCWEEAKCAGHNRVQWFSVKFTGNSQEFLVVGSTAFVLLSQKFLNKQLSPKELISFKDEYI